MARHGGTHLTVLIAGAANLFVGAIKLAAGIMVGSSAMLAEAAHSAAGPAGAAGPAVTEWRRQGAPPPVP